VKSTDSGLNEVFTTVDAEEFEVEFGAFVTLALPAKNKLTPKMSTTKIMKGVRARMTSK
jgi:hypothetical protein